MELDRELLEIAKLLLSEDDSGADRRDPAPPGAGGDRTPIAASSSCARRTASCRSSTCASARDEVSTKSARHSVAAWCGEAIENRRRPGVARRAGATRASRRWTASRAWGAARCWPRRCSPGDEVYGVVYLERPGPARRLPPRGAAASWASSRRLAGLFLTQGAGARGAGAAQPQPGTRPVRAARLPRHRHAGPADARAAADGGPGGGLGRDGAGAGRDRDGQGADRRGRCT